ncbi:hypothetical protein LEUCIP111803_00977 [Leucobacter soli]|uniref:Sulfotransferase family protein n=1 Tax=Leucobacter soli TaxID=2812850 RepID=A0A916JVN5_9MICO|nr:sulfotransferase [Leucobacter soli]CAG7606978.1 hypothetical protein LEUCIP111803_00977 [Leucobacter soli]
MTQGGGATVLFIGGWGRSGSTLLECLLSELDGVTVLGEVVHLWERGLREGERCACGSPFPECPFWSEVGDVAFGGWANVDPDRLAVLKQAVDRQRRVIHTARRRLPRGIAPLVHEYASYYRRVYDAARRVTGARVLVDSSKEIPTALAVGHDPQVDLRVAHIVRDSRGVAFSWAKTVERPESPEGDLMTRYSPAKSTAYWISGNLLPEGLRYRRIPTSRLRYEDLVARPQATVAGLWRELGLPGVADLPMTGPNEVHLHGTHSVAGNPMRFRRGRTVLRADVQWQTSLTRRDRRLVTAMSLPMLWRFGYPIRGRG